VGWLKDNSFESNIMIKKLTYAFFAFWIAMVTFLFFIPNAQSQEDTNTGAKATLYSKPVICASTLEESMDLLYQVKVDGMTPLMYFYGNSFNGDGTRFNSDFFILFDPSDDQVTVIERQGPGGFTCILSGGTGMVEFDPEVIKGIIGWSDIK